MLNNYPSFFQFLNIQINNSSFYVTLTDKRKQTFDYG